MENIEQQQKDQQKKSENISAIFNASKLLKLSYYSWLQVAVIDEVNA